MAANNGRTTAFLCEFGEIKIHLGFVKERQKWLLYWAAELRQIPVSKSIWNEVEHACEVQQLLSISFHLLVVERDLWSAQGSEKY